MFCPLVWRKMGTGPRPIEKRKVPPLKPCTAKILETSPLPSAREDGDKKDSWPEDMMARGFCGEDDELQEEEEPNEESEQKDYKLQKECDPAENGSFFYSKVQFLSSDLQEGKKDEIQVLEDGVYVREEGDGNLMGNKVVEEVADVIDESEPAEAKDDGGGIVNNVKNENFDAYNEECQEILTERRNKKHQGVFPSGLDQDATKDDIMENRVFLDGLPASWDYHRVEKRLRKFGMIKKIKLARYKQSARRKDYGFVTFDCHEAAIDCVEAFRDSEFTDGKKKVEVLARLCNPTQRRNWKHVIRGNFHVGKDSSANDRRDSLSLHTARDTFRRKRRETGTRLESFDSYGLERKPVKSEGRHRYMAMRDRGRPFPVRLRSYDRKSPTHSTLRRGKRETRANFESFDNYMTEKLAKSEGRWHHMTTNGGDVPLPMQVRPREKRSPDIAKKYHFRLEEVPSRDMDGDYSSRAEWFYESGCPVVGSRNSSCVSSSVNSSHRRTTYDDEGCSSSRSTHPYLQRRNSIEGSRTVSDSHSGRESLEEAYWKMIAREMPWYREECPQDEDFFSCSKRHCTELDDASRGYSVTQVRQSITRSDYGPYKDDHYHADGFGPRSTRARVEYATSRTFIPHHCCCQKKYHDYDEHGMRSPGYDSDFYMSPPPGR